MNWSKNEVYQKELERICRLEYPYEEFREARFLVTGAGGLIGSCLVDTLLKLNEVSGPALQVTALCRSREKAYRRFGDYLEREDFRLLIGDVCQKELYRGGEWDYIVHGAGNAHPAAFSGQPVETMKANLLGTIHLLDYMVSQAVRHPVKKMLFLSSGEIYGESAMPSDRGWNEDCAGTVLTTRVRSCYPESKRAAESLCVSYADEYSVRASAARLGYVYGASFQEENTRADAQFIGNAAKGRDIVMKSDGSQYRSYCYLSDAAAAVLLLLIKAEPGQAYNVADPGSRATVLEFARECAKAFGVKVTFTEGCAQEQAGYSRMKQEILDSGRLAGLGWKPAYTLAEGMKQIREIYLEDKYR